MALPSLFEVGSFLLIAYFVAPRMGEFLGKLSVAEAMGGWYGRSARTITAIAGIFPAVGTVAMRFTILSTVCDYFFGVTGIYAVLIGSSIIFCMIFVGGICTLAIPQADKLAHVGNPVAGYTLRAVSIPSAIINWELTYPKVTAPPLTRPSIILLGVM